jgi:hypothetical protein
MPTCRPYVRAARAALAGFGAFVALAGWPSIADACSPPPDGWYAAIPYTELPSDGHLIVGLYCMAECGSGPTEPTITVRDIASGAEVPGTVAPILDVEETLNLYSWHAASPLVAGDNYEVDVSSSSVVVTLPIRVVPS